MAAKRGMSTARKTMFGVLLLALIGAGAWAASTLQGCEGDAARAVETVEIKGQSFHLELAANDATRIKGLSQRTEIAEDGGMLFVFKSAQPQNFVMRDCFVPIDIMFLDPLGTVLSTHAMTVEEPRGPGEGQVGDITNPQYSSRLTRYSSGRPAQFAIELKGGKIEELGVRKGDRIDLDYARLKRLAK